MFSPVILYSVTCGGAKGGAWLTGGGGGGGPGHLGSSRGRPGACCIMYWSMSYKHTASLAIVIKCKRLQ